MKPTKKQPFVSFVIFDEIHNLHSGGRYFSTEVKLNKKYEIEAF